MESVVKWIVRIIGVYGLIVAQTFVASKIRVLGVGPDFILLGVVIWSYGRTRVQSVAAGFFMGLFQDLAGMGLIGLNALAKAVTCYLLGAWISDRPVEGLGLRSVTLFTAAVIHSLIVSLFFTRDANMGYPVYLFRYGFPQAVYTTLTGVLFFLLALTWEMRMRDRS
ncbi:MAG TPA: rod shape-determining protein MreD [bacterium]|nr:rod shape-determining protein MreD [bacterium]